MKSPRISGDFDGPEAIPPVRSHRVDAHRRYVRGCFTYLRSAPTEWTLTGGMCTSPWSSTTLKITLAEGRDRSQAGAMSTRRTPPPAGLDVAALLELQSGAIRRAQALAGGLTEGDLKRMLRRGDLLTYAPGVYLTEPATTWLRRAWAGVLLYWPAALDRDSALRAENGPGWRGRDDELPIQVAVEESRSVLGRHPDVEVRRVAHLAERVRWNRHPPRMSVEEAVLDSAIHTPGELDRIEVLARAVRSRMTRADRLIDTLERRASIPQRDWLHDVLRDARDGTHSVLEHLFLTRVERPHGLPTAHRQRAQGSVVRDSSYETWGLEVELDGRADHLAGTERTKDLGRDLDAARLGLRTVRLGWSQVHATPCETAVALDELLRLGGWLGRAIPCGPACAIRATA